MKNKLSGKKIGTVISVIAALAVAIFFWLIVKYIDSEYYNPGVESGVSEETACVDSL